MAIKLNSARCRKCNTVIVSKFTHYFQSCKCGAIFVDGGKSYLRCGYDKEENFEDLSVVDGEKELDKS